MTYEIVLAPNAPREEWLKHRQHGIGGSDIAAIVGLNPWKTPLGVWVDKTSAEVEEITSPAIEMGNRLEPVVRDMFTDRHPDLVVTGSPGMFRSTVHPFALANVDGIATDMDRASVLEIKTTSERNRSAWEPDIIPDYYALQVAWYCEVLGLKHAWFAVLVGGRDYLEREYVHDPALGEMLMIRAEKFWNDHVLTGEPPAVDPLKDHALLGRIYPGGDEEPLDVDQDIAYACWELASLRSQIAHLREQEDAIEASIKAALGDHTVAYGPDGDRLASWKPTKPSEYADTALLRAQYPDVWEAVKKTRKPTRRFTLHTTITGEDD